MRRFYVLVVALTLSLVLSCGDSGSGGAVDSDASLHAFMDTIALDFAQVLADVAPSSADLTTKANGSMNCPQGGSASWMETGITGGGTLTLDACRMRGINVTGTLSGFLELGFEPSVSAVMMSGPVTVSGGFDAELNVISLTLQAQIPITDEGTYWDIMAARMDGVGICAWSGGSGCAPVF